MRLPPGNGRRQRHAEGRRERHAEGQRQHQERQRRHQQKHTERRPPEELALLGLEFGMAGAALSGGILLALRPDGAFLHSSPEVLHRTPFADWRIPGLLLAAGCGGGFLVAGLLHLRRHRAARLVSAAAGTALVGLEAWEMAVIEFQPLEAVLAGVGAAVVVLALRLPADAR